MNIFTVGIVGSEIVDYSFLKNKFLYMTSGKKSEGYSIRIAVRGKRSESFNLNRLAVETGCETIFFEIDDKVHAGGADGVRNGRFLRESDAVMLFYDRKDKGHVNTLNQAKILRIPVRRMNIEEINQIVGENSFDETKVFFEKLMVMRDEFHSFVDPQKYEKLKNLLKTW